MLHHMESEVYKRSIKDIADELGRRQFGTAIVHIASGVYDLLHLASSFVTKTSLEVPLFGPHYREPTCNEEAAKVAWS